MLHENRTTIKEFILVGFPTLHPDYYGLVAFIFCIVYVITVVGNSFLVVTFVLEPSLHKPMYIIMLSLALSDIGFATVALPKIISRYWFDDKFVSFNVCFLQMGLIHSFGTLNSYIMGIMALDRYMAICLPLRYPMLMKNRTMTILNGFAWILSMAPVSISLTYIYMLPYCGPNRIYQCYCDQHSIRTQACADYSYETMISFALAMLVLLIPLAFIVYTYVHIIISVSKISSSQSRWKTFSTCSTQICIISLYYLPRCTVYIFNMAGISMNQDTRITLILFYSLFPPLINPFIYCLRTKEIKLALARWFRMRNISKKFSIAAMPSMM
ncbi:olfactory receptor 2AT4-like [Alosa sapidissima]|uniref:olfactory receptor 2AT4-like n=1 Tax=Alosa sapidissima TaxID=34773 RepID=UPI001C0A23A6|nr:olfactory receptor 2AT4-like [Alosa sapidissima]